MAKPSPSALPALSDREMRENPAFLRRLRSLGVELRRLRAARNLSLNAAADATGLDIKYIQKVERGEKNMTLATLMRFARGYKLDLDVVLRAPRGRRDRG